MDGKCSGSASGLSAPRLASGGGRPLVTGAKTRGGLSAFANHRAARIGDLGFVAALAGVAVIAGRIKVAGFASCQPGDRNHLDDRRSDAA